MEADANTVAVKINKLEVTNAKLEALNSSVIANIFPNFIVKITKTFLLPLRSTVYPSQSAINRSKSKWTSSEISLAPIKH